MLKAWVQNQDLGEIEIEEKYRSWVANLRTDRYVTVQASYMLVSDFWNLYYLYPL